MYEEKLTTDTMKDAPGGVPSLSKVFNMIKTMIQKEKFHFYELEPFEVQQILLDEKDLPLNDNNKPDYKYYGAIRGRFVVEPRQSVLPKTNPQFVLPINSSICPYPVTGEQVIVGNFGGQSYYFPSLNVFNESQDNRTPNISYLKSNLIPPTIEKEIEPDVNVRPIKVESGDLVLNGRYGNSINLGNKENKPIIKIRAGQRDDYNLVIEDKNAVVPEDLSKDKSSIYVSSGVKHTVGGIQSTDNNIILNSDSLIFNSKNGDINLKATGTISLEADSVNINAKSSNTIKMGDPRAPMLPTVNGQKLLEFQESIVGVLSGIQSIFVSVGTSNFPKVAIDAKKLLDDINTVKDSILNLEFLNFQVMTADPSFELPELPEIPELPDPEVEKIKALKRAEISKLKIREGL